MGLCSSAFDARWSKAVTELSPFLDKLGMDDTECKKFYKYFEKVDEDLSGEVDLDEFFEYFDLDFSGWAQQAFKCMDVDQTQGSANSLDFGEFMAGLYNYCTLSKTALEKFAFDLFDDDSSGNIEVAEIRTLAKLVYGKRYSEKDLDKVLAKFDKDANGSLDLSEFHLLCRRHTYFLFPAFELQRKLQTKIIGSNYWTRATQQRYARLRNIDLLELFYKLRTGDKLDRKQIVEDADFSKEGVVRPEMAEEVPVLDSPREDAACVRNLKRMQHVKIYNEKNIGDDLWFLISNEEPQWVHSDYINVDRTWENFNNAKQEQELKRDEEEVQRMDLERRIIHERKYLQETWVEHLDEQSGHKYWYDTSTGKSVWKNPFEEFEEAVRNGTWGRSPKDTEKEDMMKKIRPMKLYH